ncbi:dehydrogenase with different specificitie [Immersiella caudata]|uniref:Dehydrogenase with different specificitie n=1 Tax=Immersiella caudata TaxID=314043 RepID=A0AA39W4A1_9PEZI|nr:dehydrogenase with different specificitie [Immersiella caudata]
MASPPRGPPTDTQPLTGQVILITGATSGLGRASALALARLSPAHIYISGRRASAADAVIAEISTLTSGAVRATFLPIDLADLASVVSAAETVLARETKLDVLLANAGIAAAPPARTKDGYEVHFGTNHVGHALLATKLMPLLEACNGRVVSVSSFAFRAAFWGIPLEAKGIKCKGKGDGTGWGAGIGDYFVLWRWLRYAESKLANVVYARELAKRHPGVVSVSVCPGFVETEILSSMRFCDQWLTRAMGLFAGGGMVSTEEGALNQIWVATVDKDELTNGAVYDPVGVMLVGAAQDPALGEQLWEWTDKEISSWL